MYNAIQGIKAPPCPIIQLARLKLKKEVESSKQIQLAFKVKVAYFDNAAVLIIWRAKQIP